MRMIKVNSIRYMKTKDFFKRIDTQIPKSCECEYVCNPQLINNIICQQNIDI